LSGEFLPFFVKMIPFFGSMFSVFLVFLINSFSFSEKVAVMYEKENFRAIHRFLSHKWYFDTVYNRLINQPLLEGGYRVVFKLLDKGLLEAFGPTGFGFNAFRLGRVFTAFQSGRVYDYAWLMIFFIYIYLIVANIG
jgi:NADH:ubiquinone oxidoreductase subunit 5 (subunit L)/multisubunit Na+/H+ antiporter MnhA subunit